VPEKTSFRHDYLYVENKSPFIISKNGNLFSYIIADTDGSQVVTVRSMNDGKIDSKWKLPWSVKEVFLTQSPITEWGLICSKEKKILFFDSFADSKRETISLKQYFTGESIFRRSGDFWKLRSPGYYYSRNMKSAIIMTLFTQSTLKIIVEDV
jgi:hypothetical protein